MVEQESNLVIAFQGELGAFSNLAAIKFFGRKARLLPLPTLRDVFESLLNDASFAVVPIENTRSGDIGETIDLLHEFDCKIIGETILPIRQCLIIHRDSNLNDIRKVTSHPQALAQCTKFLGSYGKNWQKIPAYDTAGAVKIIAEEKLLDTAAIASELACEIYGMKLVMKGIEDDYSNMTRFIIIAGGDKTTEDTKSASRRKTSMIFLTAHKPGSLVSALRCFSDRDINLLKIVSRPISGRHWEYSFYVEFEGSIDDKSSKEALKELKGRTSSIKLLGSYSHDKSEI